MTLDLTGQRFGRLTAIKVSRLRGLRAWLCQCECGNQPTVLTGVLRIGQVQSCGCTHTGWPKGKPRTHGQATRDHASRTWHAWRAMHKRCTNENHPLFKNHGGRGIKVCDRWNKFERFLEDMGECPPGLTLERIKNNRGYTPSNCKWATPAEQARNRRNTRLITYAGKTQCLKDWADEYGLEESRLARRLKVMTMAQALAMPVRRWVRKDLLK